MTKTIAVASAGTGTSAAIVLSWLLEITFGIKTPADVVGAEATLIAWAASHFFHQPQAEINR